MSLTLSPARRKIFAVCLGIAVAYSGLEIKTMPDRARADVPAAPGPAAPDPAAADPQVRRVAAASTDFGFRLLTQLNQQAQGKNVFFSPFSVSDALSLALNGAGGATQQDMSRTLGLDGMTRDSLNDANGLLLPSLKNPDPQVELSVANALWASKGVTFAPDFVERCRRFYAARAESLDFTSLDAADTINGWVKENTGGKIDKLVSPADLRQSPAVLTNAVYFHGKWAEPFDKAATQDGPFTLDGGRTKTLPMMSQSGRFAYAETPQFQAVSLPYGAGCISLYVFLPKPGTDPDTLLGTLNAQTWQQTLDQMRPTQLIISLPRFKAGTEAHLRAQLSALGMGAAFGPGADFRPMGLEHGFVGDVIHKAILEVDEEGTTAAAVTGMVMRSQAMIRPKEMRVDHPFFCAIRDNTTGTLLFMGAIRDPQ